MKKGPATVDATDRQYNNNVYTDMKLLWHRRETILICSMESNSIICYRQ